MATDTETDMKTTSEDNITIENYRKLVQTYLSMNMYSTALFWADKVVALSCGAPKDVYWLAHCMFMMKQFHRAANLIRTKELEKNYVLCNYLVVRCLLEAHEYTEAMRVLNSMVVDIFHSDSAMDMINSNPDAFFDDSPRNQVQSAMLLLKGRLLEAMDNRGLAAECYRQALQYDVHCFEAFEALVQHQMLSASEEEELMDSIPISQQCNEMEASVLKMLYESKLKKYHTTTEPNNDLSMNLLPLHSGTYCTNASLISSTHMNITGTSRLDHSWPAPDTSPTTSLVLKKLENSLDLVVSHAEKLYYNCEYQKSKKITEVVLKTDPYHSECLPVHIACLVELKDSNNLFSLAHKLVDLYPDLAVSWFAVGCYYYIIGKSDPARRYLSKATSLDRLFGPAWLAYGHSFAIENEHDQAMAAYFKASQLMKGCHLPLLYIGLECGLTNNVRLAEKFFQQAQKIAPNDPFVMHEMGVISFQNADYKNAEKHFVEALSRVRNNRDSLMAEKWEPLLNNLGHTCRKLKKYEESLDYHHQALVLSPYNYNTISAIGYTKALMGYTFEAVDWFHKALGLKRDDTFSSTMLNYVIEQIADEAPPYPDAPDYIPDFSDSSPKTSVREENMASLLDAEDKEAAAQPMQEECSNTDMSMSLEI